MRTHKGRTPIPENPFSLKSFKLKSFLIPAVPFQLESLFSHIELDSQKQKYRPPRKKNLTQVEFEAIRTYRAMMI